MHVKAPRLLALSAAVLLLAVTAGVAFDRWHVEKRPTQPATVASQPAVVAAKPPLPTWGALLPEAEDVEVSGSAMCGHCTWGVGEEPCNLVLQMNREPGIIFLVGNQKVSEMEKTTGQCGAGNYYITARGAVTQHHGHNYLLVKTFSLVKTK